MWRKIRRFYLYRRDRGLGKQTIAMAAMLLLMVIILAGVIAKSIVPQKALRNEAEIPANTATGPAISTSPATGAAVLGEETDSEEEFLYESPSRYARHKRTENRKIEIQSPHVPT